MGLQVRAKPSGEIVGFDFKHEAMTQRGEPGFLTQDSPLGGWLVYRWGSSRLRNSWISFKIPATRALVMIFPFALVASVASP